MSEFRIDGDALVRETRVRTVLWGGVFLLIALTVLLFVLGIYGLLRPYPTLRFMFVLTGLGATISTCIIVIRNALRSAEQRMVFVMDDKGITQRRKGWPDVRIAFPEIENLSEELRWLVIVSVEPRRKISIPNDVKGFDTIRTELARYHPLSAHMSFPFKSATLLLASVLSWAAVLCSENEKVTLFAGATGLITLAFASKRLWTLVRRSSNRPLLWVSLGVAWLVALVLIYFRVSGF
jgi:hypothetical protein